MSENELRPEVQDVIDQCLTREGMVFVPSETGATMSIGGQVDLPFATEELIELCNMGLYYASIAQIHEVLDQFSDEEDIEALRPILNRTRMALQQAQRELAQSKEVQDEE